MGTIRFKVDEKFRSIVEHTVANPKCRIPYTDKDGPPCILLVHDCGIYLMSGSDVPQMDPATDDKCRVVAYAIGFDPRVNENCHEESSDAVGGDDFAEGLPLEWFTAALERGATTVTLKITDTAITIRYAVKSDGRAS